MSGSRQVVGPGSGLPSLIVGCTDPTSARPAVPAPPDDGPPVGVALSGGGFRATLAGLGVLLLLDHVGLLRRLRYLSSVSGGSVAAARLATQWSAIARGDSLSELVVDPIVNQLSSTSLKATLAKNLWRTIGPLSRTELLARMFDEWWLDGVLLEDLDPQVRWVFNAANVSTGVRFTFERDVIGDYVIGRSTTNGSGISVATATAASAAVPGVFPTMSLPDRLRFPCATENTPRPRLLDGGAYDNTGLEVLDSASYDHVFTIAVNVGGILTVRNGSRIPIVRDLQRANSLLYRQSTALRTREMVPLFQEYERRRDRPAHRPDGRARAGVLFDLASNLPEASTSPALRSFRSRFPEHRTWRHRPKWKLKRVEEDLAFVPTVFDKLDHGLCNALIYRGWWLAGASLAAYHPSLIDVEVLEAPPHG